MGKAVTSKVSKGSGSFAAGKAVKSNSGAGKAGSWSAAPSNGGSSKPKTN
jgi:hypothetical protein